MCSAPLLCLLLNFVKVVNGAQGWQPLKWYLERPFRSVEQPDSTNGSVVPVVTIKDALDPILLQGALDFIAADEERDGFTDTEWWFAVNDVPRNPLEAAVQNLMQLDLRSVLPPKMAERVAGVSWRCNVQAAELSHDFHFDSDEGTDSYLEEMPHIHPLLSTVTYLASDGGPTVLFDYSEVDAADADVLPLAGFISMPLAGKHLAFDPRLLHGVMAGLRFTDHERAKRIILGMNFWEFKSLESRRFEQDASQWQSFHPVQAGSAGVQGMEIEIVELPSGASISDDLAGGFERGSHIERKCSTSWIQLPHWAALPAADVVAAAEPNSLAQAESLGALGAEAQGPGSYFSAGLHVQLSALGLHFKRSRFPVGLFVKLPLLELFRREEARRGQTASFRLGCSDVVAVHGAGAKESLRWDEAGASAEEVEALLNSLLESRCRLFQPDELAMNPPGAVDYCLRLKARELGMESSLGRTEEL